MHTTNVKVVWLAVAVCAHRSRTPNTRAAANMQTMARHANVASIPVACVCVRVCVMTISALRI